jgi:hypothetical protein
MSLRLLKMHVLKPTNQPGAYETLNPSVTVRKVTDKELEVQNGSTSTNSKHVRRMGINVAD